ncbi:glutamine amidotransferase [Bifidobacterium dolichotidis]|uniref:Imidazole glycerol phosphate synthase subunit HisH n=1 Tax=Bifidobacterium dolichotidis TaxID=2306976 RepID=A0A430FS23_9BIFI|nr:imidazole glycerol phosphate synthase subunit HisH [Bifidobacterium dolichotidis]RSX55674.1 glutamine amidotransferase [Bifidobacterium dolichotidis]
MTSVVVFDYGFGNVRSMMRALLNLGLDATLTSDYHTALEADGLVVPGVGAFAACMKGLKAAAGDRVIFDRLRAGRPVLGVCVGQQIMFKYGEENTQAQQEIDRIAQSLEHQTIEEPQPTLAEGLGLVNGTVRLLDADVVPHMGWDTVEAEPNSVLFRGIEGERFYYVHSYAAHEIAPADITQHNIDCGNNITTAWCTYGRSRFVAAFEQGPLFATQFHPEKSAQAGAQLLRNWVSVL